MCVCDVHVQYPPVRVCICASLQEVSMSFGAAVLRACYSPPAEVTVKRWMAEERLAGRRQDIPSH